MNNFKLSANASEKHDNANNKPSLDVEREEGHNEKAGILKSSGAKSDDKSPKKNVHFSDKLEDIRIIDSRPEKPGTWVEKIKEALKLQKDHTR